MTFKKYPSIERLGHEDNLEILQHDQDTIVIEEKVDGGNGSFWLEGNDIHFGSRNRDLTLENDQKAFAVQQIELSKHLHSLKDAGICLNKDYIYYIEWMALHTIRYTDAPFVIGIDIRQKRNMDLGAEGSGLFLGRELREKEFERLKIECVPLIWRGTVKELKKLNIQDLIPLSKYYNGKAEGLVIKNYQRKSRTGNHQLYAKIVREEFKEENKAVFGGLRNKESETKKIVEKYCTEARIRKAVFKFTNEDNYALDRNLMKVIPSYVIKDILKEEFNEIYAEFKFLDFREMKQLVPKICLRVIDQLMTERASI